VTIILEETANSCGRTTLDSPCNSVTIYEPLRFLEFGHRSLRGTRMRHLALFYVIARSGKCVRWIMFVCDIL